MKVALIGATGFVGSRVLVEALSRGHQVSAIVRTTARLPDVPGGSLKSVACNVLDVAALAGVLAGHDAVVSAYNPGHDATTNPHIYRDIIEGAIAMIRAVKQVAVPYFVYVGGAGSLLRRPGLRVAEDPRFPADYSVRVPEALQHFAKHKERSVDVPLAGRATWLIFENDRSFAWSYLSPPLFMQPGERTGRYVMGSDSFPWKGDAPAGISIEDFAVAVVDEVEQRRGLHRHYTVTEE